MDSLTTPSLQLKAIEALGNLQAAEALPPLIALIQSLPADAYEDRMEGCTDPQYKEELPPLEAAVKALAKIGDPQAIPVSNGCFGLHFAPTGGCGSPYALWGSRQNAIVATVKNH